MFPIAFITLLTRVGTQQNFVEFFNWCSLAIRGCIFFPPQRGPKQINYRFRKCLKSVSVTFMRIKRRLIHACLRMVVAYSWQSVTLINKKNKMCYRHSISKRSQLLREYSFYCLKLEPCIYETIVYWFRNIKGHLYERKYLTNSKFEEHNYQLTLTLSKRDMT